VLQSRAQIVAARELAQRFAIAAGAIGQSDLSPLPSEPVAVGSVIATLSIPSLGVDQVVAEGAQSQQLQRGPGHVSGTAGIGEKGVSVIAGRRTAWGAPFAKINKLGVGDTITTSTVAGPMTYEVVRVTNALPDLRTNTGNKSQLVLVTSTPAGLATGDLVVIAESTKPGYLSTPQNRLPETSVRQGNLGAVVPAAGWLFLMVMFVALATFWLRSGLMDRVLVWSLGAPVVALVALLLLRAFDAMLPSTL
jgi:sortase A